MQIANLIQLIRLLRVELAEALDGDDGVICCHCGAPTLEEAQCGGCGRCAACCDCAREPEPAPEADGNECPYYDDDPRAGAWRRDWKRQARREACEFEEW